MTLSWFIRPTCSGPLEVRVEMKILKDPRGMGYLNFSPMDNSPLPRRSSNLLMEV
jgi:hypothetical protein